MLILHFTTHQTFEIKYFKLLTFQVKNEFNQHCVMFKASAAFAKLQAAGIRNFDMGEQNARTQIMRYLSFLVLLLISFGTANAQQPKLQKATFGMGCFWCTEALFQRLDGVVSIKSGYEGGDVPNPSYEDVCTGTTGHAEVTEITFNPAKISYEALLAVFWKSHDPTTLNRQGADVGTQYRSVVFYHDATQRDIAAKYKAALNKSNAYGKPVVTEVTAAQKFYVAEPYHQNYFNKNKNEPYCRLVIQPKLEKLEKVFKAQLKK
jgi:peptide-methionine (S)-S-oxide reductase